MPNLHNPKLPFFKREAYGQELCAKGDTRKGVGLDSAGIPELAWCAVSKIPRINITSQGIFQTTEKVSPSKTLQPPKTFAITKYPITYIQMLAFLNAPDGWDNPKWRNGLAKQILRWHQEYRDPQASPWFYVIYA